MPAELVVTVAAIEELVLVTATQGLVVEQVTALAGIARASAMIASAKSVFIRLLIEYLLHLILLHRLKSSAQSATARSYSNWSR